MRGEGRAGGSALLGREEELDRIDAALASVAAGDARLIDVVGEPGIGKTALVGELCDRAARASFIVLRSRASRVDSEIPFQAVVSAIDDYLATLNPRVFERLAAEERAEIGAVFTSLAELRREGSETSPSQERYRVHRAIRRLLEVLASTKPLVLAIDDLQWADEASVELTAHLLHHPPRAPVLYALARRTDALRERWQRALDDAVRSSGLVRLEPGPLTLEQAETMLPGVAGGVLARLHELAGGNPFYLEQLRERPDPTVTASDGADLFGFAVPAAVAAGLRDELASLDHPVRIALDGAAVAGDPFEADLAAVAAEMDERDFLRALDEGISSGILQTTELPRRFRFRHPIVAAAVYEGSSPGWRLGAHRRLAVVLADRGATASEQASHLERVAAPGDDTAIEVLTEAGRTATSRAPASAARWFGAALRLLPDGPESAARRLALLIPQAQALGAAGRLEESRDALRRVLAELPDGQAAARVRIIAFIGLIEHLLGNHGAVEPMLRRALAQVGPQATAEAVILRIELAADRFYMNDNEALAERGEDALAAAREQGDPALLAVGCALTAIGDFKVGRITRSAELFDEALALVDGLSDEELAPQIIVFFWLGWYAQIGERFEAGIRALERGLAISRKTGQGHLLVPMLIARSILSGWLGRLAEATGIAEEAIDAARLSATDQSLLWALTLRLWVANLAGDLSTASRVGEEAEAITRRVGDSYFSKLVDCYLAETSLLAGDPHRCREAIMDAAGPDLEGLERPTYSCELLAQAELALGDVGAARGWAERAEAAVEGIEVPGRVGQAHRVRARVMLAEGEADAAVRLALAAVNSWAERGQRLEAARARILAGGALAAARRMAEAGEELEAAHRELRACGSTLFADEAARELRKLGRRVSRRGTQGTGTNGVDGLSAREREISELVTQGHTNRQIAATLHLSEKTIEKHLSRVFEKLGVSKRTQVAATIERERELVSS